MNSCFYKVVSKISTDRHRLTVVLATFQAMIDKSTRAAQNNDPALFCDDSYLVHSEMWYDEKSGAKTKSTYAEVSSKSGSRL